MNHRELINIAQALGYKSISSGGMCQGFAMMWAQAVCANDLESFKERLSLIDNYKHNTTALFSEIETIRNKLKHNKDYKLTQNEQKLLDIPAFFDGVALYLTPSAHSEALTGEVKTIRQENIELISEYTAPIKQIGLKKAFTVRDQYNKQELAEFLSSVRKKLEGRSDIAITFHTSRHTVSARYLGNDTFEYIDTNSNVKGNMYHWTGNSDGLADQLFLSLNRNNRQSLPLTCHMIAPFDSPEINCEECRNKNPITELHADDSEITILHLAAISNDKNLLQRNMQMVNTNILNKHGQTPLMLACILNNKEAIDFLLEQKQTDPNM